MRMPISASEVLCCLYCLRQNTLQLHQLWSHTALLPMQPAQVSNAQCCSLPTIVCERSAFCHPSSRLCTEGALLEHVYFKVMQDKQLAHLDNVPIPKGCGVSCQLDSAGPSQQPPPMPSRGQCRAQQERQIDAGPAVFNQQALRAHRSIMTGQRMRQCPPKDANVES